MRDENIDAAMDLFFDMYRREGEHTPITANWVVWFCQEALDFSINPTTALYRLKQLVSRGYVMVTLSRTPFLEYEFYLTPGNE